MDDFARAIGNGIAGLIEGSFAVIGSTLRAIVDSLDRAMPFGLFPAVVFVVVVLAGWQLVKR
jgi:hypothetical protein